MSMDIWAFGCLIFEFVAGQPLFLTPGYPDEEEDDDNHLLQLHDILGPLPDHLYSRWMRSSRYFDANGVQFNSYLEEMPQGTDLLDVKGLPLEQFFDSLKPEEMTDDEANDVKSLLRQILQYDASKRPTTKEILQNPWFNGRGSENGIENCHAATEVLHCSNVKREEPKSSDAA